MDKKEKQDTRDRFYEWASTELRLSTDKVREILKDAGHTTFYIDKLAEYRALLKHYAGLRDGVAEKLAQQQKESAKQANEMKCAVPGCDGVIHKQSRRSMGWGETCSIGGAAHPIIVRTAMIALLMGSTGGRDLNEMIAYIIDERERRLHEEAIKEDKPEDTHSESGDESLRDIPERGQAQGDDSSDTGT